MSKKSHVPTAPRIEPVALSIADACAALGVGKTCLFAMLRDGTITPLRIGGAVRGSGKRSGRTLIPVSELRRLTEQRSTSAA